MRIQILVSPLADRLPRDPVGRAARLMESVGHEVQVARPDSRAGCHRLARTAADAGVDVVVAAGGDGTASLVASVVARTQTALALLPLGTGNDFARTLGMNLRLDLAVADILTGIQQTIDLGVIENTGDTFVNICGLGFDAAVAERVNRREGMARGTLAYLGAVVGELRRFRPVSVRVTADDETFEGEAMLVAVANARCYGGGMWICPGAMLDDGLLDVCIVKPLSRLRFLANLPRVFRGTHLSHPAVRLFRGRRVAVESDQPVPVMADGDLWGQTPVTFALRHEALKVVTPAGCCALSAGRHCSRAR